MTSAPAVAAPALAPGAFEAACRRLQTAPPPGAAVPLSIGGETISVQFSTEALATTHLRALAPRLAPGAASPTLDLTVWDCAAAGVPMPSPPWPPVAGPDEPAASFHRSETYLLYFFMRRFAFLVNFADHTAYAWYRDADAVSDPDRAAPLRSLLQSWLDSRGKPLLHAAAVGDDRGVILLAGGSGSGKSTTALLALASPLGYAGDDFCVLAPGPHPVAHNLYGSARVHWDNLDRVAGAFPVPPARGDKAVFFVHETHPEKLVDHAPVRALVLPRVSPGGPTRLRAAGAAEGLRGLAPSSLLQLVGDRRAAFGAMATLTRQVPTFHLDLGDDPAAIPGLLAGILEA